MSNHAALAGPHQPSPPVSDIDAASFASEQDCVQAIVEGLKISGGCVIRRFIGKDDLVRLEQDFAPHFAKAKPLKSNFWANETRRVTGCMTKSETYALSIVGNPIWQAVGRHFLTSKLRWNWVGTMEEHSVSNPQLNNTSVFNIRPGANAQSLHRDDSICHVYHPAVSEHHLGRDYGIGLFVAATKSTRHNGATRFIPGSHLWDYSERPAEELTFYAELEPGDAFMIFSGCFHAGSANTTANEERRLYSTFTCRGWCRQEENQYLANDVEKVKQLPVELQKFMGYSLSLPFTGWVNLDDPILLLNSQHRSVNGFF